MEHWSPEQLVSFLLEGFVVSHSSKVWSLMAGEAWLQECEAGGHFASTVRKQRWILMLSSLSPL